MHFVLFMVFSPGCTRSPRQLLKYQRLALAFRLILKAVFNGKRPNHVYVQCRRRPWEPACTWRD